jgi:hypothetical protein
LLDAAVFGLNEKRFERGLSVILKLTERFHRRHPSNLGCHKVARKDVFAFTFLPTCAFCFSF